MKKRILSLFMAVTLCFSTVPMTAFAQEAGTSTEQETTGTETASETVPEITSEPQGDVAVYEADTSDENNTDISGGDAVAQDAEKTAAVKAVQELIDALPEKVTAENAETIGEQLAAIDAARENLEALDETLTEELDMTRYDVICEALTVFIAAQDDQMHDDEADHGIEGASDWMWINQLYQIKNPGYYCLTGDVELNDTWHPADNVVLCLNGHSITMNNSGDIISLVTTFTLCDCTGNGVITHGEDSGGNKYTGCGVSVYGGNFRMTGGAISGNEGNKWGGGVYIDNTANFEMSGGTISGNKPLYVGGGVYAGGTFTMTGGIIAENHAGNPGGGVFVDKNSKFTMTGGEISGNNVVESYKVTGDETVYSNVGGGVAVNEDGVFIVAGTAKVIGNTKGGTLNNGVYTGGTVNNVYLYSDEQSKVTMGIENTGLTEGASIGVNVGINPAMAGEYVTIATGEVNGSSKYFFADEGDPYSVKEINGELVLANGKLHEHPVCGDAECKEDGHEDEVWVGITNFSEIKADGNYYLLNPVTITSAWSCAYDVQLCLNGHTITRRGNGNVIDISSGHSLVITDCQETAGKITNASSSATAAQGVHDGGTFTLWNGIITGNTASGVSMSSDSKFIMNGGAITENTSTSYYGGGVTIWSGGEFIMNGGTISNNKVTTTSHSAGGVYVYGVGGSDATKFIMNGGTITGNTSAASGGGVVVGYNSEFIMNGGSITENMSEDAGAGVCVNKGGSFVVSGAAQIRDNRKNGTANNVYLSEDQIITIGSAGLTTGENGAKIGITTEKEPSAGSEVQFAAGASDSVDYAEIFTLDVEDKDYSIFRKEGNLYISAHQHSWVYTADEAVITARCSKCDADGGSIMLDYPRYLGYDRNAKNSAIINNGWQGLSVNGNDITYKTEDGTALDGAPVNAGTYVANISLKGADNKTATASLTFTISKELLTVKVDSNLCKVLYGEEFKFPDNAVSYEGFVEGDSVENALRGELTYDTNYEPGDNVGDKYGITLGGLTSDNYRIDYIAGLLTVIPRTVSFSWENTEDRTYGDGKGEITVRVEGLLGTDDVSAVVEDAVLTAGTHTARVTGLTGYQARDYKLPDEETERTCTYTVAKAAQTLKYPVSESNITYYEGLEYPNTLDTSGCHTTVTYTSDNPKVAAVQDDGSVLIVGAGTARITATAAEGDNYNSAEASFTLNVAKCPVIISGIVADDKIYDGNPQATFHINSAEIKRGEGIVGEGETAYGDVKIDITNATATFEDANAGEDKIVTFRGFELSGNDAGNYELSKQPVATAAITPATITVTPKAGQVKTYGENDPDLTYTYSGEIFGETPSFTGALGRTFGETVGSYAINLGDLELKDNADGNFRADNYKLELSDAVIDFTINKATPEIKVIPKTLVRNGVAVDITKWASFNNTDPDAKLTYALVGSPEGISLTEDNKLTAANADTTADSFTIKVTAEETTNFNAPTEQTIPVTVVLKEDADVKIEAPTSKTYGDADFTLKATTIAADNGVWSWTSSNESILQIIDGGNTATPVIRVWKADTDGATLTATYTSDAYYGTASVTIKVDPKTVTGDMISEIPAQEYTGSEIKPAPEVKDGVKTLTPGGDFDFGYSDNTDAGEATLTITGKGNYTGTAEKKFTISRKDIKGANIVLVSDSFTYNGEEQTVEIASVTLPDGTDLSGNYKIIDNSNKATDAAKEIILTIEGTGNYTGTAATVWEITRIDPVLEDFDVAPDLTADLTYNGEARIVTVTTKAGIRGMGTITVKYNGNTEAPTNAGSYAITMDIGEGGNYKAATGIAAGTLTIRKAAAPTLAEIQKSYEYAATGEQTVSTAALVADATGYALGEIPENEILSQVSVSADGTLKYALTGKAAAGSTVAIPVTITSANYEDATVNVVITITKATPTGEPGYNEIHDSSKTLADAGLELINSTLNPKEGTLEWIDSEGRVLPGDTKMEEGRKYIWRFTPADPNYGILTGEVELYAPYRIIDGADSSWTQDTSGSIAIRGNGEFSKFQSVKVDGNVIDPSNYTVTEGSTIITLKADYLKTLAEGSHTFELVWTDGSASTNFTVTANTSDDKNDDDDSDDSGNTGSNNNAADSGNTNQTLITAPKTGDLSGIWITLFAVALAGLAGMLVRRKNNR